MVIELIIHLDEHWFVLFGRERERERERESLSKIDVMMSLSGDKQADIIDAFNTISRYMDGTLNINNVYFDIMVSQTYPSEL